MKASRNTILSSMGLGGIFALTLHLATWSLSALTVGLLKNDVVTIFALPFLWVITIAFYFVLRAKSDSPWHYLAAATLAHTLLITLSYLIALLIPDFSLTLLNPHQDINSLYILIFIALFAVGYIIPIIDLVCRAVSAIWMRLTKKYGEF